MNPDLIPKVGKYLFLVIGVGLLIGSFFLYKTTHKFIKSSREAYGKVVDIKNTDETSYPIVEFQTENGKNIQFTSSYGANPSPYVLNEPVKVLYNPIAPQEARINSFLSLWLGLLLTGPMALIFLAVALGTIFFGED